MSREPKYACDAEFLKLLTRRREIDLTVVALELGRDAYPDLEFGPSLQWLDERAQELAGWSRELALNETPYRFWAIA